MTQLKTSICFDVPFGGYMRLQEIGRVHRIQGLTEYQSAVAFAERLYSYIYHLTSDHWGVWVVNSHNQVSLHDVVEGQVSLWRMAGTSQKLGAFLFQHPELTDHKALFRWLDTLSALEAHFDNGWKVLLTNANKSKAGIRSLSQLQSEYVHRPHLVVVK